ncbi:MAG: M20/M25/M40 family metallo-hydrolase [Gemmatimonadota bacterium]|nr:MAG: M20/M25/M40 family metallo-hydrolase [Gemmatimonadota bacterium]
MARELRASICLVFLALALEVVDSTYVSGQQQPGIAERYKEVAEQIMTVAQSDSSAYERLTELVDRFGHRFSGSPNLEQALDWILQEMESDGLENIRAEPVMVPHWVRGSESAIMLEPRWKQLPMLGLGGSVGTPPQGITAEVLVVESFEELTARASEAEGKIVLFNAPWMGYGPTVQYRGRGAIAAAEVGAVASLIRSVTPYSMDTPHTGAMRYDEGVPRIPHAALTAEDAAMLQRMQDRGERIVVNLYMEAKTLPDVESRNVMAEIVGHEKPEEVVVLGGHIDSWDVGQGAMDDGGGCVAAWEAVKLLKRLGLRPRRTIRVVMWTNEENGLRGGNAYRDAHRTELDNHILAIESDAGVFEPQGFGFTGSDAAFEMVSQIGSLLDAINAGRITRGGGGADIGPIMREGVPGMGLSVDGSKYFWYHHTHADTIDKLDPREVALSVAALAVMSYVVADMEERLPR